MTRGRVFAALAVRDYRVYWATGIVSDSGTAMQSVTPCRCSACGAACSPTGTTGGSSS